MSFYRLVMQSLMVGVLSLGFYAPASASKRALSDQGSADSSPKRHKGDEGDLPQATATLSISYPDLFKIFKEDPDQIKQDPILQDALVDYNYKRFSFLKASEIFKVIPFSSLKEKAVQDYGYAFLVAFALQEEPSLDPGGLSENVLQFIQSQAEQKNPKAENLLALVYSHGLLKTPQNWFKATRHYQEAADQRLALAQYNLGWYYVNGQGVPQDLAKAVQYYRAAADQGLAMAQHILGWCYAKGLGVTQDWGKAIEYYQLAANQGFARAQDNLGECYANGQGVPQDLAKAVQFYQAAANQGFARAQNNLGECYANGQGVEKDLAKAVQFYQAAANQGFARAQNALGYRYITGQGVTKDLAKAVQFLRAAADKGLALAQHNLGVCYATGQGVPQGLAKAGWLYLQAAQQNNLSAKNSLKTLLTIPSVNSPAPLVPYKIPEGLNTAYELIMAPLSFLEVRNNPTSGDQKIARFAVKPTYETAQTLSQMLQEIYKAIENQKFWNDMGTLLLTSPQQGSPQDPEWKDAYVCLNNAWYCTLDPAAQNIAKTIENFQRSEGVQALIKVKQNALNKVWGDLEVSQASTSVLPKESPELESLGQKHDFLTKTYEKLSKDLKELQACQASFEQFREKLLEDIRTTAPIRGRKLWESVQDNRNPSQQ